MTSNIKGALLALTAFGIFATHDVVVRTLGAIYSPVQVLFFTSLMSFPLLTLMLVSDPTPGNLRPVHPGWVALRSAAMALGTTTAFYAFSVLPLAQVYAIMFAVPLMVTVLSIPLLGERVGLHRGLAVITGLAGVLVVVRPGAADLQLGHLAAATTVMTSSLQAVIARKIGRDERRQVMMLYPIATIFVVMGIGLAWVYQPMELEHLAGMGVIGLLGFMGALCLVWAYSRGEAAIVAPMQYSQILWAGVYGYVLFGETLDQATLLGSGIIIGSGLYIVLREAFGGRSKTTPVLRTRSRSFSPGAFRVSLFIRRKDT